MQGIIDDTDQNYSQRIDNIRQQLADSQNKYKTSNRVIVETINILKPGLEGAQQLDENYGHVSTELRRRIVTLKQRVATQVNRIKALQNSIQEQVVEMKRLEVDIDIKIRACKGSCARSFDYQVDKEGYDNIQKHLTQASSIDMHPDFQTTTLSTLKMRPLKDSNVPEHFKLKPSPEMQAMSAFNNIKQMQVVLERPETDHVAEARGDSSPSHTGKLITSSHRRESPSLVDKTSSASSVHRCTRTVTKKVISGPDGPREEIVEKMVSSDGSDCSHLQGGREGSTYHFSGTGDFHKLDRLLPDLESFFTHDSVSTSSRHSIGSSTSSHVTGAGSSHLGTGGKDKFTDLGEEEEDDFGGLQPSGFAAGSASHSKTVLTSSSSSFNKGGSTFETKSLKTRETSEQLGGVQHDQSAEDTPDFKARSFRPAAMSTRRSYNGKGTQK